MLYPKLKSYLENIVSEFSIIPQKRIETLELLGNHIHDSIAGKDGAVLIFICTHNSRRSQFGQVWAHTASLYYLMGNIRSYSGGTESTSIPPGTLTALKRAGHSIERSGGPSGNPRYLVRAGASLGGNTLYSKVFSDTGNPSGGFIAIMVCSDAEEACPFVPGAEARIAIPYKDPKTYDGTELETKKYDECCRQICVEMFYLFNYLKKRT
jgi:protein-tyrosine-phosphatase